MAMECNKILTTFPRVEKRSPLHLPISNIGNKQSPLHLTLPILEIKHPIQQIGLQQLLQ
jgi:hypothetical protein